MTKFQKVVESVSDERSGDMNEAGVWWYLKPGWKCDSSCGGHAIHEDTPTECRKHLAAVVPCDCDECRKLLCKK